MPTPPQTERKHWARRPALHFVLLGLLAYAVSSGLPRGRSATRQAIEVGRVRIEALRREDIRRTGQLPNDARLRALIRAEVDDEILLREAIHASRHRSDPVVRERLVRNMRFVGMYGDEVALFERALELGMHRSDIVVRRRLVQVMRLMLAVEASIDEVDEDDIRDHLERNAQRYMTAQRVRLMHVFFDAGLRGESLERDALDAAARLQTPNESRSGISAPIGDPLLVAPASLDMAMPALRGLLGDEIAAAAAKLPLNQWSEPLRSSYGLHLIRVEQRVAPRIPELEAVRNRVEFEIRNARRKRAVDEALERLRAGYDIRIDARSKTQIRKD